MVTPTIGSTSINFSTYNINNILDSNGFKLDTGESTTGKAQDLFSNTQKITDLATELATDLGASGDTGVQAEIENFILTKLGNVTDEETVSDFLIDALAELKTIAGTDGILQTEDFQVTSTDDSEDSDANNNSEEESNILAYALLSNLGNDQNTADIIQIFTAVEKKDANGIVLKDKNGNPVEMIAISAGDAQAVVNFFKNYGMADNDPNTMSESEVAKLHEALIALKEELNGLSPSELAKFDVYNFLKEFKENDKDEKNLEEGFKKLQDSQKKLNEAAKGSVDSLKKMQASSGQYLKGQTAFSNPF